MYTAVKEVNERCLCQVAVREVPTSGQFRVSVRASACKCTCLVTTAW